MSKLELVIRVPEDQQHQADAEAVKCGGEKVFTCADDGVVKVFDKDLKLISDFKAHDYAVYDVFVFGNTLFTGSIDTTIKTWDINTLQLKKSVEGSHEEAVRKFCTDGKLVFAGDEKGIVKGYNEEGQCKVQYNVVEEVWSLYAKDDLLYSVRDRGVTITQVKGEDNKYSHLKSLDGRAPIYADKDFLLFVDQSGMCIEVHDNNKASGFALKGTLKGPEMIITAIGGCGHKVLCGGYDNEIRLYDLTTMSEIAKCSVPDQPNSITANEQGEVFVVGVGGYICKMKYS